jgi:hypothetical protein
MVFTLSCLLFYEPVVAGSQLPVASSCSSVFPFDHLSTCQMERISASQVRLPVSGHRRPLLQLTTNKIAAGSGWTKIWFAINTWFFVFGPKHHRHYISPHPPHFKLDNACNNSCLSLRFCIYYYRALHYGYFFLFSVSEKHLVFQTDFYIPGWREVHHFQMDLCQREVFILNIT